MIADNDVLWALFSIGFVFIYFVIHLKSVFLASLGILLILNAFPLTAMINMGIFQNTFYSTLHSLTIFIVLGIAADDIFVFIDGWRQSEKNKFIGKDMRKRLAYSFRRAARATATTSSTTSAAFLANAINPMMPMSSFGIYAAILIVVVYAVIILMFPPIMVWWERNLKHKCCPCQKDKIDNKVEKFNDKDVRSPEKGCVETFFGTHVNNFTRKFKWIIIVAFLIWTAIAIVFALKLKPLSKAEDFLPADHKMNQI